LALIGRVRGIVENQWDKWLRVTNELDLLKSLEYRPIIYN